MVPASPAVIALLIANAAVFLAGFLTPALRQQIIEVGAFWFPAHENHRVWQVVTYMFLHADMGHLFFNMFGLLSFGTLLERQWGSGRFLGFYFLCGIGAGLIHAGVGQYEFKLLEDRLVGLGVSPEQMFEIIRTGSGPIPAGSEVESTLAKLYRIYAAPMLGASGAIYGILAAFAMLYPNEKLSLIFIPVPIAAKFFIPLICAMDLFSGVTGFSLFGGGVAHFAHLGGAAIGFLLMLLWRRRTLGIEPVRGAGLADP